MANVHHSHVISIIRRTHIQWTKRSVQVRKIAHMPHLHYIAKYHKCSNPALLSRFICMFNLFMSFRHLRDYSRKSCCCFFFRKYGTHTHGRGPLLSSQPSVTVTSCFVYKVIRNLESIDHLCINPIRRIGLIHK